jgi:hypothetical protein
MLKAVHSGLPVVRVGCGNTEGFVPLDNPVFIGGLNLTATKARPLLTACLLKFGALPPAANPDQPTAEERAAVCEKVTASSSLQHPLTLVAPTPVSLAPGPQARGGGPIDAKKGAHWDKRRPGVPPEDPSRGRRGIRPSHLARGRVCASSPDGTPANLKIDLEITGPLDLKKRIAETQRGRPLAMWDFCSRVEPSVVGSSSSRIQDGCPPLGDRWSGHSRQTARVVVRPYPPSPRGLCCRVVLKADTGQGAYRRTEDGL